MADNEIANVPELNFFQRIRKFFLIRGINGEKYKKAPEILKNDPEVIEALMIISPALIRHLSEGNALEYLKVHPEIISKVPKNLRNGFLDKMPELFKNLDENQQLVRVFFDKKYEFIKELPKERQLSYLVGNTKMFLPTDGDVKTLFQDGLNYTFSEGKFETQPKFFLDKLNLFSEDIILEAVGKYSKDYDERYKHSNDNELREKYYNAIEFFRNVKISNLPVETQIEIALIDNRLISKLDKTAMVQFVNNNPMILNLLSKEQKKEIVQNNPKLVRMLSLDERKEFSTNSEFSKHFPIRFTTFGWEKHPGINYDETIKLATLGLDDNYSLSGITDSVRDPNTLWEVAGAIPQALGILGIASSYTAALKINHVKSLLLQNITDPKIAQAINTTKFFNNFQYGDIAFEQIGILKVLTDKKVIEKCNPDLIVEFMKNPNDMNVLKDIVGETYGDAARKILDSRPGLKVENIPNLRIFDEEIFKNFGEGVIHNQLSYDTKFSIFLADLANHPEKIQEYKKFERLTEGLFQNNTAGTEQKFRAYVELSDLISKLDESQMTEERIDTLKLVASDLEFLETYMIRPERLEDLDSYIENRNKMYNEAISKITDPTKIKDVISRRFFGMQYEADINSNYRASTLSLNGMIRYYSVDNFLKDKRTYESELFDKDELDMIELAKIIDEINDPNVLVQIYQSLNEHENVIGPVEFQHIKQKIPEQYSIELVSQLLTPEKAHAMIENGETGISIEKEEDGIEIIKLQGADFKIMMHSMLGVYDSVGTNSKLDIPNGMSPDELWKYFEQGCATISTCLIEPGMLKSCSSGLSMVPNLGFCSIDPRLIIGMSHHDAHVSHRVGDPNPYFEYESVKMNYPEELLRRTAAQITGQEAKDTTHEYNEITAMRREQDPEKISSENYAGRVLPDYIVVYGEATKADRELAIAFAKDGKPIPIIEIDQESYRDTMYMRATQKDEAHMIEEKPDSEFIASIKKTTDKDDANER